MRKIGIRSLEDLGLPVEYFWYAYVDRLLVIFFLSSSTEKALNPAPLRLGFLLYAGSCNSPVE